MRFALGQPRNKDKERIMKKQHKTEDLVLKRVKIAIAVSKLLWCLYKLWDMVINYLNSCGKRVLSKVD